MFKKTPKPAFIIFTLIILLSIFTNFYNLEKSYTFEWDQERDAEIVYERIIKVKSPTLLGPRVVGPEGFFVGPLHYYFMTPFYAATQGNPIAGPIAAATIGVLTTISYIFISRKLFGEKSAFIVGLFSALMPQTTSWNVMYMPLLTILMMYAIHQILEKHYKYIPWAFLILALGFQAHFSTAFLAIQLAIALLLIFRKAKPFRHVIIGIAILIISCAPLILFDIRHDFMNSKLFMSFFTSNTAKESLDFTRALQIYIRNPNIFSFLHNKTILATVNITFVLISLYEIRKLFAKKREHIISLATWILIPLVLLSLYSGTISEYYFITVTSITVFFVGSFMAHLWQTSQIAKVSIALLLAFIFVGNIVPISQRHSLASLYYKKAIVKHIADQKDPSFSLYYNVPLGTGFGFGYLFRYYGIQPDDTQPVPKYTIRIEPAEKGDDLPEKEFGIYKLSKRVDETP